MVIDYSKYPIPDIFDKAKDSFPLCAKKLIIFGPPGVGKTRAVLDGFLQPSIAAGINHSRILSCSFTKAAAKELRERLAKVTNFDQKLLKETCSTIHAEALRRFRKQFSGQRFTIIGESKAATDEDEGNEGPSSRFYEDTMPGGGGMEIKEAVAVKIWDLARNNLITDITCESFARLVYEIVGSKINLTDVREWILKYENNKRANRRLDFTDILIAALRCPAPDRDLLVIDEAQDCTELQFKLLGKWSEKADRVVYICDPDQTIFTFSGAKPENIYNLIDKGFTVRRLSKSYRVPLKIHKLACAIIAKNRNRIITPYEPSEKEGSVEELPIELAASELSSVVFDEDKDVFVLARSSKLLEPWSTILSEKGVPFINERGKSPWGSPIALAVARAVMCIREDQPIAISDARKLIDNFPGRHKDYFEKGITKKASCEILEKSLKLAVHSSDLETMGLLLTRIKTGVLEDVLTELGLDDRAYTLPRVIDNHGSDALFKTPKIRLTTMHSSKGREGDLVVVDLSIPKMVIITAKKDPSTIEAERRLVYVALTRTKDSLILVREGYDLGELVHMPEVK